MVAHQCPFAVRHCGDVLAVKLMVAKVLCAAIEVLEAESEVVNPIVVPAAEAESEGGGGERRWCQRRRLAAECSHSSPFRQGQVAQLVGVPYGAMMPPTRYFSSCILGPSL